MPEQDRSRYAADAYDYASKVVAGIIPACKWIKLACQRHIDDLKKQESEDFPYYFDPVSAGNACFFTELLPHTKGKWAVKKRGDALSNLITWEPWQRFIICSIFGWKRKKDDLRRYRQMWVWVPRKNGKSLLAAAIGVYMLVADGEFGAEVYSGASTEKQAFEVFRPAKQMIDRTPSLLKRVTSLTKSLSIASTGARFEPVVGNPGDGASPSCPIVDEYHEHKSDALFDTMETGMGAREQPLLIMITTAGVDISSPCYLLQKDGEKILEGSLERDDVFVMIYTVDEDDDWKSVEALKKANPNFGVSVFEDFLVARQTQALTSTRKQSTFKTKHLNIWVRARSAWMNMELWSACADTNLNLAQFEGEECWIGLDLSSKKDFTAKVYLFRRRLDDGHDHWYWFGEYYLPEDVAEDAENSHYQQWLRDGDLIATDGNIIDYHRIEAGLGGLDDYAEVIPDIDRFVIREVGYDPHGATELAQDLQDRHQIKVVEIPQRAKYLSEPMKWIEALVIAGRLHHNDNPVLNWMMSNITASEFADGTIFPRKEVVQNKIDGPVAGMIAMARAMAVDNEAGAIEQGFVDL